jgi:hypothetical protein
MSQSDYHLIGTNTRYSSTSASPFPMTLPLHRTKLTQTGWTARVETVLEYFQIPYTNEVLSLAQVPYLSPFSIPRITLNSGIPRPAPVPLAPNSPSYNATPSASPLTTPSPSSSSSPTGIRICTYGPRIQLSAPSPAAQRPKCTLAS